MLLRRRKKRENGEKEYSEEFGKACSTNGQNNILIHRSVSIQNGNKPLGRQQPPFDGSLREFILYTDVKGNAFTN